ncbi:hypothetical protein FBF54_07050 [Klebsiella pneumoniae]|nr:hypothetical protein FBF55_04610 [Klebsiella pneumoniae]QHU72595.1 hypothetical protein FBF54_07050 [Klebsiella pneumoniae]
MFAGKKSAQIREILISESAWEEMTCLFAPSLNNNAILPNSLTQGISNSLSRVASMFCQHFPLSKKARRWSMMG